MYTASVRPVYTLTTLEFGLGMYLVVSVLPLVCLFVLFMSALLVELIDQICAMILKRPLITDTQTITP